MKQVQKIALVFFNLFFLRTAAQNAEAPKKNNAGWFTLGARSTMSAFSDEGVGLGTGGSFRIQLSNQVNTDWFADYITINIKDKVRSDYYHIGWSVLFYPIKNPKVVQPFVLAGHCFDYNKITIINDPAVSADRWGSAVQAGLGTHFNLTDRFDVTLMTQYMIHLTTDLRTDIGADHITIIEDKSTTLHGHLLTTVSLNYKIGKLWNR
jgi:hypothetical protein